MDVLVSATAFEQYGDQLVAAAPDVRFLLASPEGVHLADGASAPDARPEVAWLSGDLFAGGRGVAWFRGAFVDSPELRWVHSSTAGLDSPLFVALMERGIRVTSAHIYAIPVGEYVLRAVLDAFQDAGSWRAAQGERAWRPHEFTEVAGSTWTVVGLGNIGRRIAGVARALEAQIIGVDQIKPEGAPIDRFVPADALLPELATSDVVVLARPASPDEPPLVDAAFIAAMKPGSLLVNASRGSLVDEAALLAGLDEGRPGRAALDVMATEPLPADSPLWTHPAGAVTPHTAGQGLGRHARGATVFASKLGAYLAER